MKILSLLINEVNSFTPTNMRYQNFKHLIQKNHNIEWFEITPNNGNGVIIKNNNLIFAAILSILTFKPIFSVVYKINKNKFDKCIEKFKPDFIYCDTSKYLYSLNSKYYGIILLDQCAAEILTWKNLIRNDPRSYFKLLFLINLWLTLRLESKIFYQLKLIICVSELDRRITNKFNNTKNTIVLPTMVKKYKSNKLSNENIKFCFYGGPAMRNVDAMNNFINNIKPYLIDNIDITWVGKVNEKIEKLLLSNNIKYTGFIKDVNAELTKYNVLLCPYRMGEGMKTKIAECLAVGMTIIGNKKSFRGYNVKNQKCFIVAKNNKDFALRINKFSIVEYGENFEFAKSYIDNELNIDYYNMEI